MKSESAMLVNYLLNKEILCLMYVIRADITVYHTSTVNSKLSQNIRRQIIDIDFIESQRSD